MKEKKISKPKFMNAALIAVKENLSCGHCASRFVGSDSQAWKVKYEKSVVYCSYACRHAALRQKFSKPAPNMGACGSCGEVFYSKTAKKFCNLTCYLKSDQYAEMMVESRAKAATEESIEKRAEKARKGMNVRCLDCGELFYQKRETKSHLTKKLCSRVCYRSYMSKRFDRWIANPKDVALPQCYDEFLDQNQLECIIEGCDWKGHGLSAHVNMIHGYPATDFKKAAGFNLTTGVISKDFAIKLRARPNQDFNFRNLTDEQREIALLAAIEAMKSPSRIIYKSREGAEHRAKSVALRGI